MISMSPECLSESLSLNWKGLILIRKKTCEYSGQPRTEPQWGPKGPFVPHPSSSIGVFKRDRRKKVPRNVLVTYLLGLKALFSRRGGACCSLGGGALELHAQHPLPEQDAWSMPAFTCLAPGPLYHLSAPQDFLNRLRPVIHVTVSALALAWMWAVIS